MVLLNKRETARYLRISIPTLDRHIASGLLIPARVGRKVFFREGTLLRFLINSEANARRKARERTNGVAAKKMVPGGSANRLVRRE